MNKFLESEKEAKEWLNTSKIEEASNFYKLNVEQAHNVLTKNQNNIISVSISFGSSPIANITDATFKSSSKDMFQFTKKGYDFIIIPTKDIKLIEDGGNTLYFTSKKGDIKFEVSF